MTRQKRFSATRERPARATKKRKNAKRQQDGTSIVHIGATATSILHGESLEDWDDEELLRGKRRAKDGTFKGRSPQVVPHAFVVELTKRRMNKAHALMAHSLVDAAQMLHSVVNDPEAPYESRIHAAEIMFNRILGKPRETMAVDITSPDQLAPWQRAVATGLVGSIEDIPKPDAGSEVIDGEIVEDQADSRTPQPKPRRKRQAG